MGYQVNFLEYLENYLTDRKQYTVCKWDKFNPHRVEFGVPQGSHIGPSSFSVNVNDMCENVDCDLDQFADDSTAHTIGPSVDSVPIGLRKSATQLQNYSKRNSLTIHPDKCEILILSKKLFVGPLMNVELCGKSIEIVRSSKCLGVTLDDELKWDDHVQNVCKSFSQKVKRLNEEHNMPKSALLSIYFQGILLSALYDLKMS